MNSHNDQSAIVIERTPPLFHGIKIKLGFILAKTRKFGDGIVVKAYIMMTSFCKAKRCHIISVYEMKTDSGQSPMMPVVLKLRWLEGYDSVHRAGLKLTYNRTLCALSLALVLITISIVSGLQPGPAQGIAASNLSYGCCQIEILLTISKQAILSPRL